MTCYEGQPFGANYNPSYSLSQLRGHSGQDWNCGWHSPIHSEYDGVVYKVLTVDRPANDGSGFTGVFMIVNDGIECFEWLVGHCDPCVTEGQVIKKGDVVGYEANHGTVYSGNIQITLAMQAAGDQRGFHRHYQKRPVQPTKSIQQPALSSYNDSAGTYRDAEGNYYQIWDYNNGFHGCVDPSLPVFNRDLDLGARGYDVWCLQRYLRRIGLFTYPLDTGYYGTLTRDAVAAYQKSRGIAPTKGYFGPKTRASILAYLAPAPMLGDE